MVCLTVWLTGCSDDDKESDSLSISDIVGTWSAVDNSNTAFVFEKNGDGYVKDGSLRELFTWSFSNFVITIRPDDVEDDSPEYKVLVRINGHQIEFEFDGQIFAKAYEPPVNDDGQSSKSDYDKKLIGEWWDGDPSRSLKKYYFCNKGRGYCISSRNTHDYGVYYSGFTWDTKESGKLRFQYVNSDAPIYYDYTVDGDKLKVTRNGRDSEWTKMDDEVDESFDYTKQPFADNYLYDKNMGYYYEITKVVSGCNHAGAGDNMNDKYLHFFGTDGQLTTTGLRIVYFTPRWEGIDSSWPSGTYVMSSPSGAYKYVAMAWAAGREVSIYEGAKLKISKNGSFTTYDFKDDKIELHVVVKLK